MINLMLSNRKGKCRISREITSMVSFVLKKQVKGTAGHCRHLGMTAEWEEKVLLKSRKGNEQKIEFPLYKSTADNDL